MNPLESYTCQCPYCSETIDLVVDCSQPGGDTIEDCQVCCQPIEIRTRMDDRGVVSLQLRRDSESF